MGTLDAARYAAPWLVLATIWPALGACSIFFCTVVLGASWLHLFSACGLLVGGVLAIRLIERRVPVEQVRHERPALCCWCVFISLGGVMWGGVFVGVGLNDAVDLIFRGAEEVPLDTLPALPPAWISIVDGEVDMDQAVTARWRTRISSKGSGSHFIDHVTTLAPVLSAGAAPQSVRAWACAHDDTALTGPIDGRTSPWVGDTEDAYREALQGAGRSAPEDAFCVQVGQGDKAAFVDGAWRGAVKAYAIFHAIFGLLPAGFVVLSGRSRRVARALQGPL